MASEAQTPEALMRSRYTAYALKNIDYIRATTDPQLYQTMDWKANQEWAEKSKFTKLEVLKSSDEGNKGTVEFKAYFSTADNENINIHHELSKFRKHGGKWFFRDGKVL